MATIYMQPTAQSPSADGSYGDPYDTGSMATAETAAGAGGTIIFKDGAYTETTLVIASAIITAMAYKAESSGGVTITVSNKLTFGNGSLAAAVTYQGLNFVNSSTSTSADRIVFDSDTTTRHFFTQCSFKACVFMEAWGMGSKCYVKFMQCVFELSLTSGAAFHWFDQRNNNSAVEFDGCTILNIPGAGRGGNIFNKLDLTFTNTIVYDGDSLSTGFEAAGATPILHPKNCFVKADGTDLFPNANNIALDPLFIDYEDADYRLRPSSPCIGGGLITNQSRLESAHPTGKWFDSNALGGGDGSYATPYNVIEEAIDSFTSALAVVFVKEGDHILKTGFNGVNTGSVDFAQAHTEGIKVIGESKKSRFLTGTNLSSWAMWATTWTGAPYSPPNSMLSPMFFEDIVVLFNEVGASVLRGWICGKSITMTNCIIDQVDGAFITGTLFYSSPSPDIVLTDCIIAASMCKADQVQLIPKTAGLITAKRCTFADLGRAVITLRPSQIMLTPPAGSTFTDCIFYSSVLMDDNPGFFSGAAQITTAQFTRCSVFNAASNSNFSDFVSQLADRYRVDCVLTDPKLVNATVTASSLQLRPSSPCVGATGSQFPASSVFVFNGVQAGGADGTYDNPYDLSNISSAETAAGSGGTVIFKDGNYTLSTHLLLASSIVHDINYQPENREGVHISGPFGLRLASYTYAATMRIKDLRFTIGDINQQYGYQVRIMTASSGMIKTESCSFVISIQGGNHYLGLIGDNTNYGADDLTPLFPGANLTMEGCSVVANIDAGSAQSWTQCSFFNRAKAQTAANGFRGQNITLMNCSLSNPKDEFCNFAVYNQGNGASAPHSSVVVSNTIIDSPLKANYLAQPSTIGTPNNNWLIDTCNYRGYPNTAKTTITNSTSIDPLFINPNSNLQLRPTSPLIGKGGT